MASSLIDVAEQFYDCETGHLIQMIADMLMKLTQFNDRIAVTQANLTRFHSRQIPPITVLDYLARCVKYAALERTTLLMLLVYIDRVCERHRTFVISSLTVHRFVIAALTAAAKELCDSFCTNVHYARVGGISLRELNTLELEFLFLIDWRLSVNDAELQQYYVNLVRQSQTFQIKPGMTSTEAPLLCGHLLDRPYTKENREHAEQPKGNIVSQPSVNQGGKTGSSSSGSSSSGQSSDSPQKALTDRASRMSLQ